MPKLTNRLRGGGTPGADPDSPEATIAHGRLIRSKPLLRAFYAECYEFFASGSAELGQGAKVELGSGGGFLREFIPDLIRSDLVKLPEIDLICSALDLPFSEDSVSAYYMMNVFHHLQDPERFLTAVERSLAPGGKLLMVEPASTWWGRIVWRYLHHEPFDPDTEEWKLPEGGRMSQANSALPWIVFDRDRSSFEAAFPRLEIQYQASFSPFLYLASGGVSLPQLVPTFSLAMLRALERMLAPADPLLGLFLKLVIVKRPSRSAK